MKYLSHGEGIIFLKSTVAHLTQKRPDSSRFAQHGIDAAQTVLPVRRIVTKWQRLLDIDNGINAEAAKTFVQPPIDVLVNLLPDFWIFPVEIGLFPVKDMEILFVRPR